MITFIPHAWGPIKGILISTLQNPALLYDFIILFTALEAIFGLFLIVGFLTRLSGLVVALLAWGIGAAAGWLGSTCVDEWQWKGQQRLCLCSLEVGGCQLINFFLVNSLRG